MRSSLAAALSPSRRWWTLALVALIASAAALRLAGYNFSLPYVDHPDEPVFYLTGREWRGTFDLANYLNGYPPLYIWLNIGVQWLAEPLGVHGTAPTVQILRLISIGFNLLTLALIADTARRAGGWLAGFMAGAAWAFAPLVTENGVYAAPDPLVYLLVIAAIWFAVVALTDPRRAHWCIWSVAAGCLAILAKYYVLSAVLPGMIAACWVYWHDHRRGRRYLTIQIGLGTVTALVAAAGIAVLAREGATARGEGLANILNPGRVLNNLYYALLPVNPPFVLITLMGGTVAYLLARPDQRLRRDVVALAVFILISVPWLAASFSLVNEVERMKDVLPATTAACVLLGVGLAQIARIIPRPVRLLVVIVPALLVFAPQLNASYNLDRERTFPDTRVILRQWADANLTPGTVLVGAENHKTFNPYWGGIEGQHWFDWILIDDMMQKSPAAWRSENGASYAVLDEATMRRMETTAQGKDYLAQMLPVREIYSTYEPHRGPDMTLYRLWWMQHVLDIPFRGGIHLYGYDIDRESAAPGETLTLTCYWRSSELRQQDNYSLFVHLVPQGKSDLIAQVDGAPAHPERPTLTWTVDEILISQPFSLTIPADAPPGEYDLQTGLYNYQTGERLTVNNSDQDTYLLTEITVR